MSQGGEICRAAGTVTDGKEEDVKHTDPEQHTGSLVMRSLPPELWQHILSFCQTNSLGRLGRASRRLKSMVDDYINRLPRSADMLRRSRKFKDAIHDGEYHLAVTSNRFGIIPLRVYCHGMSTENPKEYITLRHDGRDDNFSELKKPGNANGPGVRTTFSKVRLDVAKMQLVCNDFTFAQSRGWGCILKYDGVDTLPVFFQQMPLGTAQTIGYGLQPKRLFSRKGKSGPSRNWIVC